MLNGIFRRGLTVSSPAVAITSNPTKQKKQLAAPASIPDAPWGAKFSRGVQFLVSTCHKPTPIMKMTTDKLMAVTVLLKTVE